MNSNDVAFNFPVLGFRPEPDAWAFPDLDSLTRCGPRTLKDGMQNGMELVDSDGSRWVVRSVRRIGNAESLWRSVVSFLLYAKPQSRIEHELEPLSPLTLQQVQDRLCAVVEADPEIWCEEDERDTVPLPLVVKIKATTEISQLPGLLGLDTFEDY